MDEQQKIKDMYGGKLASQKAQLQQGYDNAISGLNQRKAEGQKNLQTALTRTAVESDQARRNFGQQAAASGLSSGAMAQARIAQNNQLQSDLTALRAAQQQADDNIERERGVLGQQLQSAIAKAQGDNDYELARALYKQGEEAQRRMDEQKYRDQQQANWKANFDFGKAQADQAQQNFLAQMQYKKDQDAQAQKNWEAQRASRGSGGSGGGGGSTAPKAPDAPKKPTGSVPAAFTGKPMGDKEWFDNKRTGVHGAMYDNFKNYGEYRAAYDAYQKYLEGN